MLLTLGSFVSLTSYPRFARSTTLCPSPMLMAKKASDDDLVWLGPT